MNLYFLRHAEALEGQDDAARPLSKKGRNDTRRLGRFLVKAGVTFDAAYASPLVRARETAERLLQCWPPPTVALKRADQLLNEASPAAVDRWLNSCKRCRSVLLVGHAPSLSEHVARRLGLPDAHAVQLPKCGLAVVAEGEGSARLKLFLGPKPLRGRT